jgi:hypothetical protein
MDTFFKLPSLAPANIAIKFACVAVACLLLWWLVTFLLLQIQGKYRGDLKVAIRSFWAAVIVFPLLQVYTLLELNYNLGELGTAVMRLPDFYLTFIPEYLAGFALIVFILLKRKRILESINLKRLRAED